MEGWEGLLLFVWVNLFHSHGLAMDYIIERLDNIDVPHLLWGLHSWSTVGDHLD